jgi:TonB family protein
VARARFGTRDHGLPAMQPREKVPVMKLVVVGVVCASTAAFAQTWPGDSAKAAAGARASLAVDGPWLPGKLRGSESLEVHDARGARPKILEHVEGVRLFLYVDPSALVTSTLAGAVLAPTADALRASRDGNSPGMNLGAGRQIDTAGPDENGATAVTIAWHWGGGNALELRGYVATAKLAKVYRNTLEDIPAFQPDVTLPGDYKLLDAPNGKPFATSKNTERLPAMALIKKSGFTLVRVAQGAVGWIATSQVKAAKVATGPIKPKRVKVKDIVQPVKIQKRGDGDVNGDVGGEEGGVEGGVVGGVMPDKVLPQGTPVLDRPDGKPLGEVEVGELMPTPREDKGWLRYELPTRFGTVAVWARKSALVTAAPPPPPPPPPAPPQAVAPSILEGQRLTGDKNIVPSAAAKAEIERSGKDKVIGSFKLCVSTSGQVTTVSMLKSTGISAYDNELESGVRTWSYKPFLVNGKATPVCTAVTFIYSKK